MISSDKNVGHGSLSSLGLERVLDGATVGDLIELNAVEFDILRLEGPLGSSAMRA